MELLNVGGNADNLSQCGVAYSNSNNGFSNSRTNIGARLNFYLNKKDIFTFLVKSDGYEIAKG